MGVNGLTAVLEPMELMDDAAVGECSAFSGDAPRRLQAEFAGNSCGDSMSRFVAHLRTFPSKSPFLVSACRHVILFYLFAFCVRSFFLHVAGQTCKGPSHVQKNSWKVGLGVFGRPIFHN